jgi:hypothetical protein
VPPDSPATTDPETHPRPAPAGASHRVPHDLPSLRDRAILLVGFAGGLRRSEIVGLYCGADDIEDDAGWVAVEDKGPAAARATSPVRLLPSKPG